ncbi:succinate dehydrogenase cytochrome b subunit [Actinomyces bowdenii]|uniref:succinate dehydrogenase cytochrome b subunit n=1 Tax=Actinomyces bowdenii TaxID=131109 RepID=UPI001ABD42BB|nr:succinate dehydrogenase cytochrome b subunit [Actinomyces bowdenii]MBO3725402.1 succinate dehydrogenase cytochrome b subunit [Actinomyces bowdenii]
MRSTSQEPAAPPLGDSLPARSHASRTSHPFPAARRLPHAVLKTTMAVTGSIMGLFVLVHMIGNLKVFQGPQAYNGYAAMLRSFAYPLLPHEGLLWALRVVLLACILAHAAAGTALWRRARLARGPHRRRGLLPRSFAARTMLLSGAVIGAFVVVHLLDLTLGRLVASPDYQHPSGHGPHLEVHAYANLVASLSRPWMALLYTAVMVVIGLHLAQGLWSVLHDLGGTAPRLRRIWLALALLVALAITAGNGALPLLVLTGVIS